MRVDDWHEKLERQFKVEDPVTGEEIEGNQLSRCTQPSSFYVVCLFNMSPSNQNFGLLQSADANKLLTYRARWVYAPM